MISAFRVMGSGGRDPSCGFLFGDFGIFLRAEGFVIKPQPSRAQLWLKASRSLPQIHAVDAAIPEAPRCPCSDWPPSKPPCNKASGGLGTQTRHMLLVDRDGV